MPRIRRTPMSFLKTVGADCPKITITTTAPTSAWVNHDLGDFVLDKDSRVLYVLTSKGTGVATWETITHSGSGVDFQESVLKQCAVGDATETEGNRYLSTATGGAWTDKYIYEYSSGEWVGTAPSSGMMTYDENTTTILVYTGAAWQNVSATINSASETAEGIIELATTAEATAGTDTTRAVTAAGMAAKLGAQTDHGVLVGSGSTAAVTPLAVGTDGQVLVGSSTADPVFATLASSDSSITYATGAGTLGLAVTQATESQLGGGEIATDAECTTGTDDTKLVSAKKMATYCGTLPIGVDADETTKGVVEIATQAEVTTGAIDDPYAITPLKLKTHLASPNPIGATAANTGAFTSLDANGAVAFVGGQVDISTDNAANAVNIGLGTSARAIAIGSSAAGHTLTIGSSTGAGSIDMYVGTGNFTLNGVAGSTYTIGAATTTGTVDIGGTSQTGTITLGSSDGISTVAIAAGTGASTVNVANGTGGNTVSIGNGANGAAQIINLAGGASAANSTVNILSGNGTAGTQTLNVLTGTRAGALNLGTGAAAHTVILGSTNTTASTTVQSGTGDLVLTSADAITLDAVGVLELNSSAGAIGIGNDDIDQAINIGTAGERVITIGNVVGVAGVAVNVGTGNFAAEGAVTSTYEISSTGANTGTCKFGSGTGARTVEIAGGGTGAKIINIGAAASADVITIGTADGASQLDLKTGTGNFSLDGAAATVYTVGTSTVAGTITIGGTAQTGDIVLGDSSDISTVKIADGEGASTVNILGGATAAKALNICQGAIAGVIKIGNATGASQLDLKAGTGNFSLDGAAATVYTVGTSTVAGTITIGGTAQTGDIVLGDSSDTSTVKIADGEGASTVNILGGATAAKAVNICQGAVAGVIAIGTADGASQLDLKAGTGNFSLDGAAATVYTVGASTVAGTISIGGTAQTGTITLGDSSDTNIVEIGAGEGATTVNIGCGATSAKSVQIATGAVANNVDIGSESGAADTKIMAGTGGLTLAAAGIVDVEPATDTQAAAAITIDANVGYGTFTGLVTAAAASQVLTITNAVVTVNSAILVTIMSKGVEDAQLTIDYVKPAAGSFTVAYTNNGAAALASDVTCAFWVLKA